MLKLQVYAYVSLLQVRKRGPWNAVGIGAEHDAAHKVHCSRVGARTKRSIFPFSVIEPFQGIGDHSNGK